MRVGPRRIEEDVDLLAELPPLLPVVTRLTASLSRDDVDLREVEGIIRNDPVVAARLIGAANAAAYAAHAPTTSIHSALLRLGLLAVRRLAFLLSLYDAVPGSPAQRRAFWSHSLAVAHAAEVIAQHVPAWPSAMNPEPAFLAALLHDLGLLALARHYPREEANVIALAAEKGMARWQIERELLDTDHAEIGARLAAHWSFPPVITTVIRCHHTFLDAPLDDRWIAAVVALADALCNEDEASSIGEGAHVDTIEMAIAMLGLPADALGRIVDETRPDSARDLLVLEAVAGA